MYVFLPIWPEDWSFKQLFIIFFYFYRSKKDTYKYTFFKTPNEQQINIDNLFADLVFDKLEINYYLFNRFRFVCFCLEREVGLLIYSVSENKWKCFKTEFIYLYKTYYKYLYI